MIKLVDALLSLIGDAVGGRKSEEDIARSLIDAAFESGVAPSLLAAHLTEKAAQDAEFAADLAQAMKMGRLP